MTRKSAAAFFLILRLINAGVLMIYKKVIKVFFLLVMMLNVWLTNVYNKQSGTITTGKARIVATCKDKPS